MQLVEFLQVFFLELPDLVLDSNEDLLVGIPHVLERPRLVVTLFPELGEDWVLLDFQKNICVDFKNVGKQLNSVLHLLLHPVYVQDKELNSVPLILPDLVLLDVLGQLLVSDDLRLPLPLSLLAHLFLELECRVGLQHESIADHQAQRYPTHQFKAKDTQTEEDLECPKH